MNITRSRTQHQTNQVGHFVNSSSNYTWFNLLTSEPLFDTLESLLPDHRERQYPPTESLSMFLTQAMNADRSFQNAVNQAAADRVIGGLPKVSTRTGGYCRARQRLPKQMVEHLTKHVAGLVERAAAGKYMDTSRIASRVWPKPVF